MTSKSDKRNDGSKAASVKMQVDSKATAPSSLSAGKVSMHLTSEPGVFVSVGTRLVGAARWRGDIDLSHNGRCVNAQAQKTDVANVLAALKDADGFMGVHRDHDGSFHYMQAARQGPDDFVLAYQEVVDDVQRYYNYVNNAGVMSATLQTVSDVCMSYIEDSAAWRNVHWEMEFEKPMPETMHAFATAIVTAAAPQS